ncbi:hypothetical protein [Borreliella bissettiae]|uniref:hypothetical protein n=1 Tax=Borrelia bissettiae TaxID=64897 RepID=UPI003AB27C04
MSGFRKSTTINWGFTIKKVDGLEYICKAKRYSSLKKILARIVKDYKEIFLGRLQKNGPGGVAAVPGSGDSGPKPSGS